MWLLLIKEDEPLRLPRHDLSPCANAHAALGTLAVPRASPYAPLSRKYVRGLHKPQAPRFLICHLVRRFAPYT